MRARVRRKRQRRHTRRRHLHQWGKTVGVALLLQHAATGVSAQAIRPDGNTATQVNARGGGVIDVTTATQVNRNAFNSFSTFGVAAGQTVNLHVPGSAQNLINIVRDARTDIDGVLNAYKDGRIGGNVYFANPYGFVVGSGGVVNVGSLHVTTPTLQFVDGFFRLSGVPDAAAVSQLLAGSAPISPSGLISIQGQVNAADAVSLRAGVVDVFGQVFAGQGAAPALAAVTNLQGLSVGTALVADAAGSIRIVAEGDVTVGGTLAADGAPGRKAGEVVVAAGGDVRLAGDALISARGRGAASDAGTVTVYAQRDASLADRAAIDVRGGEVSGDGGFAEFSAKKTVHLVGGVLQAGATSGRAGTVLIDPTDLVISNATSPSAYHRRHQRHLPGRRDDHARRGNARLDPQHRCRDESRYRQLRRKLRQRHLHRPGDLGRERRADPGARATPAPSRVATSPSPPRATAPVRRRSASPTRRSRAAASSRMQRRRSPTTHCLSSTTPRRRTSTSTAARSSPAAAAWR